MPYSAREVLEEQFRALRTVLVVGFASPSIPCPRSQIRYCSLSPNCSLLTELPGLLAPARSAESPPDFGFSISDFRLVDHRITLSALAKTLGGIVNPICLAAFRLMMNSNFVGCSTGKSAGFVPFRILST